MCLMWLIAPQIDTKDVVEFGLIIKMKLETSRAFELRKLMLRDLNFFVMI